MIKSATYINYQAHKNTHVEFVPGINMFTGHSGAGKTSFFRLLELLNDNRPNSVKYVSKWAKEKKVKVDKDGKETVTWKLLDEMRGEVTFDNGTVTRIRNEDPKKSGYIVHHAGQSKPKPLKAVKTDVPEEIKTLINMGEVNFAAQHGEAFLLRTGGKGGAEAARFLNSLVDFTAADMALVKAEALNREAKNEHERIRKNIVEIEQKLQGYEYLDELEELVEDAEDLEGSIANITDDIHDLNGLLGTFTMLSEKVESIPNVEKLSGLIKQIESHKQEIEETGKACRDLSQKKESLVNCNNVLSTIGDLVGCTIALDKASGLSRRIDLLGSDLDGLDALENSFTKHTNTLRNLPDIEKLQNVLNACENTQQEMDKIRRDVVELTSGVSKYKNLSIVLETNADAVQAEILLDTVQHKQKLQVDLQAEIRELNALKSSCTIFSNSLSVALGSIKELEDELGDVCPACGGSGRCKH